MRWASSAGAGSDFAPLLQKVLAGVREGLAGAPAEVAFVFLGHAHAAHAAAVRDRVRASLGGARLVGATAAGVLGGGREYETATGLSVTAAHLPGVALRVSHLGAADLPDPDAGPSAWHRLLGVEPSARPSFVLVLDPYSMPGEALLTGLDFAYPGRPKVGGIASGTVGPGDVVLFADDRLHRAGAVVLAVHGDVALAAAVAQGCRGVGAALRVTDCAGNLLRGLDGRPAIERLQEVVREEGVRDPDLLRAPTLFLGVETDPFAAEEAAWLVRNVLGRERDGPGIFVGESLRNGLRVRLHLRDRVASSEDLDRTLAATADGPGAGCRGALLFSCGGRGMRLYGVPDHDTRAFHARFGNVPVGGFFCAGEIGPVGETTCLHGFTSAFALFRPATA